MLWTKVALVSIGRVKIADSYENMWQLTCCTLVNNSKGDRAGLNTCNVLGNTLTQDLCLKVSCCIGCSIATQFVTHAGFLIPHRTGSDYM